jgi:hypothetical protein
LDPVNEGRESISGHDAKISVVNSDFLGYHSAASV